MAPTTAVRMTPLAALLDAGVTRDKGRNLATTLAILRAPSPTWMNYDDIAALLTPYANGRELNRVTIKTISETTFRIPNTRYVQVGDKTIAMPKAVDAGVTERYLNALDARSIDTAAVRAALADEATARTADEAVAQPES